MLNTWGRERMFQKKKKNATRWFLCSHLGLGRGRSAFIFFSFPLALIFISWLQLDEVIYHHPSSWPCPCSSLPLGRAPAPAKVYCWRLRQSLFAFPDFLHISDPGLNLDSQLLGNPRWSLTTIPGLLLTPFICGRRGWGGTPSTSSCAVQAGRQFHYWVWRTGSTTMGPQAKAIWMAGKREDF